MPADPLADSSEMNQYNGENGPKNASFLFWVLKKTIIASTADKVGNNGSKIRIEKHLPAPDWIE